MEVVSRRHAELRRQEAHWELLGLGSNGTFVDGERITQVRLEHGQNIVLAPGGPTLAFKLGGRVPDPTQRTIAVAVPALGISVNERQKALQVAEIAASDYFQQLQKKAAELRARPTAPER
jgi:pSer/pThr/pTyr-binding forkhead associated (FHA) protein